MARQIIKNTMIDPTEMTCECCKSVFTYTFEDIQRREETSFFAPVTRRFVTCPVCKYDNDLTRVVVELQEYKKEESAEEKPEEEET